MSSPEFQMTIFGRLTNAFIKIFIVAFICYGVYLFYTRPELDLSESYFRKVMLENGYKIYTYIGDRPQNAEIAYTALNMEKTIKINYVKFNSELSCKNFYESYMNKAEEKHTLKVYKDQRVDKVASEKQSFAYDGYYYSAIYSKNAIAFAEGSDYFRSEFDRVFKALNDPVEVGILRMISLYIEGINKLIKN